MGCCVSSCFNAAHNLPYATPSRTPPDPELFPRYFQNKQGLWLHYTEWAPPRECPSVRAVLFIISGLGEHTARYDSVALRFAANGYHVFCMDNQGAGGSEGERRYMQNFYDFVDDFELFRRRVLASYPSYVHLSQFLLGHSMGGLIATHVALREPKVWSAVVLSGPAFEVDPKLMTPFKRWLINTFSHLVPKMGIESLRLSLVSTNTPVVQLAQQDPLWCDVKVTMRWGSEMLRAMDDVWTHLDQITFPFLIVHGAEDKLCSLGGSRRFAKEAVSGDKRLIEYDGLYHEVLTEVRRHEVLKDVEDFLEAHLC